MKLIVFPEYGTPMGSAALNPVPNNWHLITLEMKRQVEERGWSFHLWPDIDFDPKSSDVVALYQGIYPQSPNPLPVIERSVLLVLEPPVVKPRVYDRLHGWPMPRVLTFVTEFVDNKRIFYMPFPVPTYTKDLSHIKRDRYICAISSNKQFPGGLYEDRRSAYLGWGKDLDLYGWGWHTDLEIMERVNYCGVIDDKIATLAKYKYAIVFENQVVEAYNSEKLYHCIQAGTIPLYRGNRTDIPVLEEVTEVPWCKRLIGHLEAICET